MLPKRLLSLALLVAAVLFVLVRPVEAATMLRQGADATVRVAHGAVDAFATFLDTLL